MFFRRQKGEYRETDRVTRYKLIKSGKHWLRASTSLFGLFKVLRGGVDTTQVMTEVVEDKVNPSITGLDIIKGIAATGAVLGGTVATQTKVFANEAVAVEKTLENPDLLVTNDTVVLGTTSVSNSENSASLSTSLSESTSMSESVSKSSSASASASMSTSASVSASTSNSASTSASVSNSTSISQSTGEPGSFSLVASLSGEQNTSATATDRDASVSKESTGLKIDSALLKATEIDGKVSASAAQSTSTTTSIVGVTAGAIATAEVSAKQQDENRKKLTKLSAEMGEYLAKAVGLPNTDSAITKVNAAVTEIEKALADPTSDLTAVVQKATVARNSIANAVLRAHSGARDARNGKPMLRDASLRASWAPQQGDGRMNVSSPTATFDKATGIATYTMNVHADSALSHVGVKIEVGKGGHVQSATFNGSSMEKTYAHGSEAGFSYRHDQNRNLEGQVVVRVKYDNNVPTATANMQVQVSSAPIYENTPGNGSAVQSASVPTGYRQQTTNTNTNTTFRFNVTAYKEVFNGDVVGDNVGLEGVNTNSGRVKYMNIENRDVIPGVRYLGPNNNERLDRPAVTARLEGTVGGNNASAEVGKTYVYRFVGTNYSGAQAAANVGYYIKGFNERHDIQSGDTVQVSDLDHLTPDEVKEVYNNFVRKQSNLTDLSKNGDLAPNIAEASQTTNSDGSFTLSYPGTKSKIDVATDGTITVTYRDGSTSVINASLEKEKIPPVITVTATRNGKPLAAETGGIAGDKYYYYYAGDDIGFEMKAVDNKGKLREFKLVAQADGYRPASEMAQNIFGDNSYGTGTATSLSDPNGNLVATESNPAVITATGHMKDDLTYAPKNEWRRNAVATDKAGNVTIPGDNSTGNFFIKQRPLNERYKHESEFTIKNPEFTPVVNKNSLTGPEKDAVTAAIYAKNDKGAYRIDTIEVKDNGEATIVYKDGTRSEPIPPSVTINERPKLVIPYDNPDTKEIYLYRNEPVNITLKATDDSGKINSLKLTTTSGAADGNASNYGGFTGVTRSNPITSTTNQDNATITLTGTLNKSLQKGAFTERKLVTTDNQNTSNKTDNNEGYIKFVVKDQTDKYNAVAKVDTIYTYAGETAADLGNAANFVQLEGGKSLPAGATVRWTNTINNSTTGTKSAVARVTYSDGSIDDVTVNYKVLATIAPKGPVNDIQGTAPHNGNLWHDYVNKQGDDAYPSGASQTWRKNGQPVANSPISTAETGRHNYQVTFTYPVGRTGAGDTTKLSKTVDVVHDVYKFESDRSYVFTQNKTDEAGYKQAVANPKEAVTRVSGTPDFNATNTNYKWVDGVPSLTTVGTFTKQVEVELPLDSTGVRVKQNVPVTVRVNPQAPEIADDSVNEKGGLPNRSIVVTNVTPGATVTLTIAGQTIPKQATGTSVTFDSTDLKRVTDANNGLLPTGDVTVKQEKVVSNPAGGTETLTSATTSKTITKETEKPNVEVVLQVKNGDKWVDQPKKAVRNDANDENGRTASGYELYAGDEYRFVVKTTDNSGKIRNLEVWDGRTVTTNMTDTNHNSNGKITNITGDSREATSTKPATLTIEGTYNANQRYEPGNIWSREIRTKDLSENENRDTTFKIVQGKLSEKFPGKVPATVQVSNTTTPSEDDKQKILAAVKASNPQDANRIQDYEISNDGTVTITYKDGTTNTVKPDLSDSDYRSKSASTSASASASTSAVASVSASTSAVASASASTSAVASASASTSAVASASASTSAVASASASTSAVASASASTSAVASASASTSAVASASASTSAVASASASTSAVASASASTSAVASASASTSAVASASASTSAVASASASTSAVASASASTSAVASASASTSAVASASASTSAVASASASTSAVASASASTSAVASASASTSAVASASASTSAVASASASTSAVASASASTSAVASASASTSAVASASASTSAVASASASTSAVASASASTSAVASASASTSAVASASASTSAVASASASTSAVASASASTSAVASASASTSAVASASASTSAVASASASTSAVASASASTSAVASASASTSAVASASASTSAVASASASTSAVASASASTSAVASASASTSAVASASASTSAVASASASTSAVASASASTSASTIVTSKGMPEVRSMDSLNIESIITSDSISNSVSTSKSVSLSLSKSASVSTSASVSASTSAVASASASTSAVASASASVNTSVSNSASTSTSISVSNSANHSNSQVGNTSESAGKSQKELPNTGTKSSTGSVLLGALAAVTGIGLVAKRRKRDEEE